MKKITLFIATLTLIAVSTQVNAQTQTIKEEIKKEIKLEDVNGVKTLTIETITNGKKSTEVYKGEEAEKKVKELEKSKAGVSKTIVIGKDGKQKMKIEKRVIIKEEIEMN